MREVVLTCDFCHEKKDHAALKSIHISMLAVNSDGRPAGACGTAYDLKERSLHDPRFVCVDCLEKMGMVPSYPPRPDKPEPPTFEDLLRQIINEELDER